MEKYKPPKENQVLEESAEHDASAMFVGMSQLEQYENGGNNVGSAYSGSVAGFGGAGMQP